MPKLANPSYEIFAQNVARGKTQVESYVLAGFKQNDSNCSQLAQRPEVAARITEINGIIAARAMVTSERVLAELARIGFADVTEAAQLGGGRLRVTDSAQLSPDLRAAIAEVSQTRDGVKIKMHDKRAALETLGKHLGMFKENVDLNINMSLADLVNGSYKLERSELTKDDGKTIEGRLTSSRRPARTRPRTD
jgi:phage terminase small subunit